MAHPTSVDRLDLGDHVCWTFDDDDRRLAAMARFVTAALERDHRVIYYLAAESEPALLAGLRGRGVPVAAATGSGQLRVRPAEELFGGGLDPQAAVDRLGRAVDEALADGYRGARIVTDLAWAAAAGVELELLIRYEELLNPLFAGDHAVGVCLYDRRRFPACDLHRIGTAHPGTTWAEDDSVWEPLLRMHRTGDPPRLRLVGELDLSNRRAVPPVLTAMRAPDPATPGRPPLVIDASELTFADVSFAGLLLQTARIAPAGLQIRGCRPAVARTLECVGASEVPGIAVTEAPA
ncbi:MAG TPA: MEDS domain-containing protein [Natronosporangium sp.]